MISLRRLARCQSQVRTMSTSNPTNQLSLDEFFSNTQQYSLSDEKALQYMKMAADLSLIRFKDQDELLRYKNDFQSALLFIRKLEEVNV